MELHVISESSNIDEQLASRLEHVWVHRCEMLKSQSSYNIVGLVLAATKIQGFQSVIASNVLHRLGSFNLTMYTILS